VWDFYDFFIAMVWIFILVGSFNKMFEGWKKEEKELEDYLNSPEPQQITDTTVYYEDDSPMTKNDWDVICRTAVEKAKSGDSRARDWVMKNIVTKEQISKSPFSDDAIIALVKLGFKKPNATNIVSDLVSNNTYSSADDLIKDALNYK